MAVDGTRMRALLFEVLLESCVILLGSGEIAGLQILGKFLKRRGDSAGSGLCIGGPLRLKRGEVRLGLREIPRLKVLADLLKFRLEFL